MNAEHEEFRALLARLQGLVGSDLAEQAACARELMELLRAHIAKEDGVLFPMAERLLSPTEREQLASRARPWSNRVLGEQHEKCGSFANLGGKDSGATCCTSIARMGR